VPVSPAEDIAVAKPTRKRKTTTKKGVKWWVKKKRK
jgi:hypothetical protein